MSGLPVTLALLAGAAMAFFRAVHVIDRMSHCTCSPIAESWIALGVSALWVICAVLTGSGLPEAVAAFAVSVGAVLATDRRVGVRNRRRPVSQPISES